MKGLAPLSVPPTHIFTFENENKFADKWFSNSIRRVPNGLQFIYRRNIVTLLLFLCVLEHVKRIRVIYSFSLAVPSVYAFFRPRVREREKMPQNWIISYLFIELLQTANKIPFDKVQFYLVCQFPAQKFSTTFGYFQYQDVQYEYSTYSQYDKISISDHSSMLTNKGVKGNEDTKTVIIILIPL